MSVRPGIVARWVVLAVLLGLGPIGCGSNTSKVRGKVTHNNKPVVWGTVTLVDKTGQFHQADIDLEGNYELDNVPVGTVKIAVVSQNPDPPARGGSGKGGATPAAPTGFEDPREKFLAGKEKGAPPRPKPPAGAWFPIPPKFNTPEESGMAGEIKGRETVLNIDLK